MTGFDLRADYMPFRLEAAACWEAPCAALFGASGSGKTTILEAFAGIRPECAGRVTIGGRDVSALPPEKRRVGWVPQDAALFPHLDTERNAAFGAGRWGAPWPDGELSALRAALGLPAESRPVAGLSGGERQRLAILRAVAARPDLLLLDEPLASVDRPRRAEVVRALQGVRDTLRIPMILVSHDPHEILALASFVVVLDRGRVVATGDPADVLATPAALSVLESLGADNLFRVDVASREPGLIHLRTAAGCEIAMAGVPGVPDPVRVAVRGEDIVLAAGDPGPVSARNRLRGRVTRIDSAGAVAWVRIEAGGEAWTAKVTPGAVVAMGLAGGSAVTMLIKAHSVRAG